jgi:hypothetical protein
MTDVTEAPPGQSESAARLTKLSYKGIWVALGTYYM